MSKAVQLVDVARRAGVSPATASRALSAAYGVSPVTRERVLAAAADLDYVASPEATRLARGGTGRIALVVPHLERWFFSAMVAGLESVLSQADLDVLLYHVDDLDSRRAFFEELPARRKVDAVVVVAFAVSEAEQRRLERMRVTVIAAGGQNEGYPFVSIDDHRAGRQAVDQGYYQPRIAAQVDYCGERMCGVSYAGRTSVSLDDGAAAGLVRGQTIQVYETDDHHVRLGNAGPPSS